MQKLTFKPFEKAKLIEALKVNFPSYKIQTSFGALQVRTSGFTATGNVKLKVNAKKGTISTQTNYDMLILMLIVSFPLGIYVYTKKEKQLKMEHDVADRLNEILEPI